MTLDAFGQMTVDGAITAHGGAIKIISEANPNVAGGRNFDAAGNLLGRSIWIGDDAALDVSGQAYTARDLSGRPYGVAGNGGSIQIGGVGGVDVQTDVVVSTASFIVIRPGAFLDASGASAIIDPAAGANTSSLGSNAGFGAKVTLAGDGGSIALDSSSGIYNDGTLRAAAGGAGAAGGSLSVTLETPVYFNYLGAVPTAALKQSVITITRASSPRACRITSHPARILPRCNSVRPASAPTRSRAAASTM